MAYDYHARAYMGENLDSMPDYATALKIYEARKPYIKGKHKGERPLGNNRRHDRSRISLDDNGNIRVTHWQTDIITYHPDGAISLDCGSWSSISTAQIMQELLGIDRICRVHCKIYYRHGDHFYLVGGNSASGIHTDPNGYPINVNDEYVWLVKKEEMAKYRKKYAFFLDYAKQVLTMSSDFKVGIQPDRYAPDFEGETLKEWYMVPLINQDIRHDSKARDRARDALFDYLDSLSTKAEEDRLQAMYELLTPLTYMMGSEFIRGMQAIEWSCNYTQFKRGFENLIKHHFAHDIFTRKLASKKSPVRDPNAKYMG